MRELVFLGENYEYLEKNITFYLHELFVELRYS